jgi:hypothetical protein
VANHRFQTIFSSIEREKVNEVEHILEESGVEFHEDEQVSPACVYLPWVGSVGSMTAMENLACLNLPLTLRVRVRRQDWRQARAAIEGRPRRIA